MLKVLRLLLLILFPIVSKGNTVIVYVYNTEFSINMPGNPVSPAIITQGDSIKWVWVQGGHTTTAVTGSSEQWNQPINSSNPSFTRAFNNTGVFIYYCIPHGTDNGDGTAGGMWSSITVLAAGSGACCLPNGICTTTTEGNCLSLNGIFNGAGTLCDTTTCVVDLELTAIKDNILYESATGSLSNALGNHLYTGNNNAGKRRAVLAFDLSDIPEIAEINDVQLKLFCNSSSGINYSVTAQRLLQDWGEGTSQASGNEGNGAASTTNDATWIHTFYNSSLWTTAGGNFSPVISASTTISAQNSTYTWSGQGMIDDVEHWIEMPDENFGWIMRGDEATTSNTKRFSSRHTSTTANRPKIHIQYTVPPTGACCLPDGNCTNTSETQCTLQAGTYQGDGTDCEESDCGIALTPYLDALPLPGVAQPVNGQSGGSAFYRIKMTEQMQQLHSELPPTRVWGYNGSYPGPTIEAFRDSAITVQWINDLRDVVTGQLRTTHVLHVDTCLHGPDMTGQSPVGVVHLHGGKVPPQSDGYPEAAFPPGDSSGIYTYPNNQLAGTLWYHDHALGITRLNVMMGMAGLYMLRDSEELALNLPAGEFEIPLVIQDKSLNADGTMNYPVGYEDHFFGDVLMVNGKVWPYLNVKKGKYRFRVVNGSNSRVYTIALSNGATFKQIGTELGLCHTPVVLSSLTLLPGERYDLIMDFSGYATGTEIILTNSAPAPYPGFAGVGVIPNVMKFIVQNQTGFTGTIPEILVPIETLNPADADAERLFTLQTIPGPTCDGHTHPMWTINGLGWDDITEFPVLGSTEIWTWHNQSGISHPMHMHMVSFQVLDRQAINEATGQPEGPILPPAAFEIGWKDTAHSPPGFRTRVIARFDGFTGLYPYHCHILEHEDHEMMRQFDVQPCSLVFTSADDGPGSLRYAIDCLSSGDTIYFASTLTADTILLNNPIAINKTLTLYNANANRVTIEGNQTNTVFDVQSGAGLTLKYLRLISGQNATNSAIKNQGTTILDETDIDKPGQPGHAIINQGILWVRNNCHIHF